MNQKIIVFFQEKDDLWYTYGMLELSSWERYLIFNKGFETKHGAIQEVIAWKSEANKENEIYVDFWNSPNEFKRLDKAIIYFKRAENQRWYTKFLFKYAGVWHYVFLSIKTFTAKEAIAFAETWRRNSKAAYEIYISEEVFE